MLFVSDATGIYREIYNDVCGTADPQACAILAAGLLIAGEIGRFADNLTDDKALGALDLHTMKIAEAIESAGAAISESLEDKK